MGIRVRKSIGYGLRGFKPSKTFLRKQELSYETTLQDFAKWCVEHKEYIFALIPVDDRARRALFNVDIKTLTEKKRAKDILGLYCLFDNETDDQDTLMLLPLNRLGETWTRYDDSLDYHEEVELHGGKDRFVSFAHGIFPYDKGEPPLTVAALALWLGIPEIWPKLHEALYVYWS
jgi:hypothetical protein